MPKLTPTRQATTRAKRQGQVTAGPAHLDRAPSGLLSICPNNVLTRSIARLQRHCASGKSITKDIAHVVPDLLAIKIVGENSLADIRLEDAILNRRNLERDAPGLRVAPECLAVGRRRRDLLLRSDTSAYRPEVNSLRTLITHDCATDGVDVRQEKRGQGSEESDGGEKHIAGNISVVSFALLISLILGRMF